MKSQAKVVVIGGGVVGVSALYHLAKKGWGDDVAEVQRLWLAGDREAAAARVPIEIGLRTNLIGPPDEIRRRLREYRGCGVDTLRISPMGDTLDESIDGLGQVMDLVAEINSDQLDEEVS